MGSFRTREIGSPARRWLRRFAHVSRSTTGLAAASVLDLVFPARCSFCRGDLGHPGPQLLVCETCEAELVERGVVRCRRCGAVGADALGETCRECRGAKLWFDRVVTLGAYDGPLRSAVLRTKTAGHDVLAFALGTLLARTRREQLEAARADVVMPVPMHWMRRVRRGTNGASIVAARLAKELRLPLAADALARRRNTRVQNGLLRPQRFANVRGAFRWTDRYDLHGAHVLLVDDILTTGATASETARTLKRAGASQVVAVVLARTSGLD